MRDIPGKVLRLLFVLAAGYVLVRVGFYYYVEDRINQLINDSASYANISYAKLETDIGGRIDITDTRVIPVGQDEAIEIGRISVQGPNVLELLRDQIPLLGKGGPPAFGELIVKNINISLDGSLATSLDKRMQGMDGNTADICGVNGITSLGMARSLGMSTLNASITSSYRYDVNNETLSAEFAFAAQGMQSVELQVSLLNVAPEGMSGEQARIPSVASMVFTLGIKPEYGTRVALGCAGKHKISVADYKLLLADQFVRQQASLGVDMGWGLRSAVKRFYRDWGGIEVSLNPRVPINPVGLMLLEQKKMLDSLGLKLAINGEQVTDLRMSVGKAKGKFSKLLIPEKEQDKSREKRLLYRSVYRQVGRKALSEHIYHSTRMLLRSGQTRNGVLVGIEDNIAQLEQRRSGGWFTSYVRLSDVTRIEVLFREQLSPLSTRQKTKGEQTDPGDSQQASR